MSVGTTALIGLGITGGLDLTKTIIASNAAGNAAKTQQTAATQAGQLLSPYAAGGQQALAKQLAMYGITLPDGVGNATPSQVNMLRGGVGAAQNAVQAITGPALPTPAPPGTFAPGPSPYGPFPTTPATASSFSGR